MNFDELEKDFSETIDNVVSGKLLKEQVNKIITHLRSKYNKDFVPISYGDRYDKLNDDITIVAVPKDNSQIVFKASRK